jgi:ribosome-binding factor A
VLIAAPRRDNEGVEGRRYERVVELIREEITAMVAYDLDDARLSGVEVTDVQVAPDMKRAVVSVYIPAQGEEATKVLEALKGAKGYLRKELAQRIDLFHTPDLYFDVALNLGPRERVNHILKRIERGRPKDA